MQYMKCVIEFCIILLIYFLPVAAMFGPTSPLFTTMRYNGNHFLAKAKQILQNRPAYL